MAVISVIATVVVALGAPLVTWLATRDVEQRAAQRARVMSDLVELRSALDGALADLHAARSRADEKRRVWDAWLSGLGEEEEVNVAQTTLAAATGRTRAAGARLRIRLGQKGLFNVYWFSYQELRELNACTAPEPTTAPASPDVRREAVRELRKLAVKYGDWFSDLAFEKAHSEVDEDQPASPSKETLRRAKQLGDQDSEYLTTCEEALDAATVPEVDR